jgi:hypothetical protein
MDGGMRGSPYDAPQSDRRRTVLRSVFFFIIVGTLPFYLLGFILWGTAPDNSQRNITPIVSTQTPIGGDVTPTTPPATWTPRPTNTPLSGLGPTPGQFIPPVIPTQFPTLTPFVVIPTGTPAPTLTPFPTNTPLPLPTETPLPLPSDTPRPQPTNTSQPTNTPQPLPTNTSAGDDGPLLPPSDTPQPGS